MKIKRLIMTMIVTVAALGPIGASQGLAYMQTTYGSHCGPLTGVASLLASANLLVAGNCKVNINGKVGSCKNEATACSATSPTGLAFTGSCKTTTTTVQSGKKTVSTYTCDCVKK